MLSVYSSKWPPMEWLPIEWAPLKGRLILGTVLYMLSAALSGEAKETSSLWNIPPGNPYFTGRAQEIKEIQQKFATSLSKIVTLSGPSGFGKSQVAKQFAHQATPHYDIVWWFKATRYLEPQVEEFAHALSDHWEHSGRGKAKTSERLLRAMQHTLRTQKLRALIIFDDVHNFEEIKPYLPFFQESDVLITTRNSTLSMSTLHLGAFLREESFSYINRFFGNESESSKQALAEACEDAPVALALAIDYIASSPGMTISSYLNKQRTPDPLYVCEAQAYDSPMDGYQKDLHSALVMNLQELKRKDPHAYETINFLSFLHHDGIDVSYLEEWHQKKNITRDVSLTIQQIRHYSFVEVSHDSMTGRIQIHMLDLIHKIINDLIPLEEKKKMMRTVASLLLQRINKRADVLLDDVMQDTSVISHCLEVSKRAHQLGIHLPELTSLRVKLFDLLACHLRDYVNARMLQKHIDEDIGRGVKISRPNEITYLISSSVYTVFHGVSTHNTSTQGFKTQSVPTHGSSYEQAIYLANQALSLLALEGGMSEEKIRIIADLMQYYCAIGELDSCVPLLSEGGRLLEISQSLSYNALFIYAASLYFVDKGDNRQAVEFIQKHQKIIDQLASYSPFRLYISRLLVEILVREKKEEEAQELLKALEQGGHAFYKDRENTFYAHLDVLKAQCLFKTPHIKQAKDFLHKALEIYAHMFGGEAKHRKQAFSHFVLGEFYELTQDYKNAKAHYLKSEIIYDALLKHKALDDVSLLYKQLAMLGITLREEEVTHIYLKKHLRTFGLQHPRTQEIIHQLDLKGLPIPY